MTVAAVRRLRRVARRVREWVRPGPLVLCYHRIGENKGDPYDLCVSPERFQEQIEVVRRRGYPISLSATARGLAAGKLPARGVVITFDDGYADNYLRALPVLEKADCPATVYVIAGAIGRSRAFWWEELYHLVLRNEPELPEENLVLPGCGAEPTGLDEEMRTLSRYFFGEQAEPLPRRRIRFLWLYSLLLRLPPERVEPILAEVRGWAGAKAPLEVEESARMMNRDELTALDRSSLVTIGAHTLSHPLLEAQTPEVQWREIAGSKKTLEEWLDHAVPDFAYPYGGFDQQTMALALKAGFATALTCDPGLVRTSTAPHRIPRIMARDWSGDQLEEELERRWRAG